MIAQVFVQIDNDDDLDILLTLLDHKGYSAFVDHIVSKEEFGTEDFQELKKILISEE